MAGLPFKSGLVPVNKGGAGVVQGAFETFQTSVAAPAMYTGDIVALSPNGQVVLATSAGQDVLGVVAGFFWVDPTTKQPVESRYKIASVSSAAGLYNGIRFAAGKAGPGVKVITDENQLYAVKATTSVAVTKLGDKIKWQRTAGSNVTGQSDGTVSAGTPTSVMILRVAGVYRAQEIAYTSAIGKLTVDNDWGVDDTVILVKLDDEVRL